MLRKYINPLKDVKQEQNPLNKISFLDWLNRLAITKPKKNDPKIETIKLLSIINLKKVARKDAKRIKIKFFIFISKNFY